MIKRRIILIGIIAFSFVNQGFSQINYSMKAEVGYLKYRYTTVDVDAGPNWKGYNLENANGMEFNAINGLDIKNKFFVGLGIGYLNFEGIDGISIFSDFEYLPLKTRLTPLVNFKLGYSHIWNQYDNGTGTGLGELCIGLNYRMTEKMDIYLKSGYTMTQQSLLIPIRLGIRF